MISSHKNIQMFQTTLFLLAWYSLTTTLFQAVQSDVFLSDCKSFFHDAASFIQTFIGWTIDVGQSVAQISTKIPNPFIAGMVYWLFLILVVGICVAGTGILAILIEIKVFVLSQGVYLGIRCYLKNRLGTKQYW